MSTLVGRPETDRVVQGDGTQVTARVFSWPADGGTITLYSARPETPWSWFRNPKTAWHDADLLRQGITRKPWGIAHGNS